MIRIRMGRLNSALRIKAALRGEGSCPGGPSDSSPTWTHTWIFVWLGSLSGARLVVGETGSKADNKRSDEMLDLIFIALVLVFFGSAFWYVRFCERV